MNVGGSVRGLNRVVVIDGLNRGPVPQCGGGVGKRDAQTHGCAQAGASKSGKAK